MLQFLRKEVEFPEKMEKIFREVYQDRKKKQIKEEVCKYESKFLRSLIKINQWHNEKRKIMHYYTT